MSASSRGRRIRCVGENGAIVRSECELDSELVGEIDPFQVCLCSTEAKVATNGTSRARLISPVIGWVSLRLFADVDEEDDALRVTVDYREGNVSLRLYRVEVDSESTVSDLKKSLAAMTRVPTHQQRIAQHHDTLLSLQDSVRINTLPVVEGRVLLVLFSVGGGEDDLLEREENKEEQTPLPRTTTYQQRTGTILGRGFTSSKRQPHPGVLPTEADQGY